MLLWRSVAGLAHPGRCEESSHGERRVVHGHREGFDRVDLHAELFAALAPQYLLRCLALSDVTADDIPTIGVCRPPRSAVHQQQPPLTNEKGTPNGDGHARQCDRRFPYARAEDGPPCSESTTSMVTSPPSSALSSAGVASKVPIWLVWSEKPASEAS